MVFQVSECDLPVLQDLHCDVSYLLREIRNAVHGTLRVCGETNVARRLTMAARPRVATSIQFLHFTRSLAGPRPWFALLNTTLSEMRQLLARAAQHEIERVSEARRARLQCGRRFYASLDRYSR